MDVIEKIEICKYLGGEVRYNVKVFGIDEPILLRVKELGIFHKFKWIFTEVQNRIPGRVKSANWEKYVNIVLADAEVINIPLVAPFFRSTNEAVQLQISASRGEE